jgi:hypothetical protein
VRYPPNWESFGRRAEKLRNDFMLADSRPDFVIVFPGGRDTADLAAKAVAVGIKIVRVADKDTIIDTVAKDEAGVSQE